MDVRENASKFACDEAIVDVDSNITMIHERYELVSKLTETFFYVLMFTKSLLSISIVNDALISTWIFTNLADMDKDVMKRKWFVATDRNDKLSVIQCLVVAHAKQFCIRTIHLSYSYRKKYYLWCMLYFGVINEEHISSRFIQDHDILIH